MTTYLNDDRLHKISTTIVRQPLLRVVVNDTPIKGEVKASVHNVGHFHADSFEVEIALTNPTYTLKWWSEQETPLLLDVQIGMATTNTYGPVTSPVVWQSLILGNVDHMQANLATRSISLEGRDLSSKLIDLKLQDAYPNLTASDIAEKLAGKVGLQYAGTPTDTHVGVYYAGDHDTITNNEFSRATTGWDLLTNLAERERYDLFVEGRTLHFQPLNTGGSTDRPPWLVRYVEPKIDGNVSHGTTIIGNDLSLQRSMTLAKDVVVVVTSWNSGTAKQIKASYPSSAGHSLHAAKSNLQQIVRNFPNLKDTNEALARAQAIYAEIVKNERIVEWREPGDLVLNCRDRVLVEGTNSSFDQLYYIDSITRSIGFTEGFEMNIRAKNQNTQSQTVVG